MNPILNIVAGSGMYYLAGLICLLLFNKKNVYEFYEIFWSSWTAAPAVGKIVNVF